MDIDKLKTELTDDPLARGYSGMTDAAAAADLNTVYRTKNKTSMTGSEILNNVDATEWAALDAAEKQTVWDIVHLGTINPFGVEATLMIGVFEGGSATITALQAARKDDVSRAVELGLGNVKVGNVQLARK